LASSYQACSTCGGIAHDFNNLLTGIIGVVESLADRLSPDDPSSQDVDDLRQAVQRGAGLTRQLLAFSRQQPLARVVLDLNALLRDTSRMLTRLIGESITLSLEPSATPLFVRCDRTQVEQLLVNLAVNARDAMPDGGRLVFALEEVQIQDNARQEHPDARPGRFAKLSVRDTGEGMDEATLSRIFEPFFTTKPIGAGTGLGLSMVHGIVSKAGVSSKCVRSRGKAHSFRFIYPWSPTKWRHRSQHRVHAAAGQKPYYWSKTKSSSCASQGSFSRGWAIGWRPPHEGMTHWRCWRPA